MPKATVESNREYVLEDVVSTLKLISPDHATVSFWNTVRDKSVTRKFTAIDKVPTGRFPFLNVLTSDEDADRAIPNRKDRSDFHYMIIGYVENKKDPTLVARDLERVIQDVRKALAIDIERGHRNGSPNALSTYVNHVTTDEGELVDSGRALFVMTVKSVLDYTLDNP